MEFKDIVRRDSSFVVWGKWDKDCCHIDLARFPFNPSIEGSEKEARILAERFAEIVESEDLDSKLNRYETKYLQTDQFGFKYVVKEKGSFCRIGAFGNEKMAEEYCDYLNQKK